MYIERSSDGPGRGDSFRNKRSTVGTAPVGFFFFFLCRSKETIIKKGRIKNATKSKKKADRFEGFVVSGNVELIVRRKCRPDREVITGREKRKYTKNSYKNKKE